MKKEKVESFITSMLKLKLDQAAMFEWQRHSHDSNDVSPYRHLLEFLDLRVHASKRAIRDSDKRRSRPIEKKLHPQKPSYTVSVNELCAACKLGRHSLFSCQKFKSLPHEEMMTFYRTTGFVLIVSGLAIF